MHRLTIQYAAPEDPEAFDRHYFDHHVELCRPLPGLVGLAITKPRSLGSGSAPYLVAELDFSDGPALDTALRSDEMARVARDAEALAAERSMFTAEVIEGRAAAGRWTT